MYWIVRMMQKGIADQGNTIRSPDRLGRRARRVARAEKALTTALSREPTEAEVADAADLTAEELAEVRRHPPPARKHRRPPAPWETSWSVATETQ